MKRSRFTEEQIIGILREQEAGAGLVGRSAGPVRTPLVGCRGEECAALKSLIDRLRPQWRGEDER